MSINTPKGTNKQQSSGDKKSGPFQKERDKTAADVNKILEKNYKK